MPLYMSPQADSTEAALRARSREDRFQPGTESGTDSPAVTLPGQYAPQQCERPWSGAIAPQVPETREPPIRVELMTYGLRNRCSTN